MKKKVKNDWHDRIVFSLRGLVLTASIVSISVVLFVELRDHASQQESGVVWGGLGSLENCRQLDASGRRVGNVDPQCEKRWRIRQVQYALKQGPFNEKQRAALERQEHKLFRELYSGFGVSLSHEDATKKEMK